MSSTNSPSRRSRDEERSSSSTISTSRRQQRLEAVLNDLESSFERESHSVRYTSHVLDIHTNISEDLDDLSSIASSRHSTSTVQWLLNDQQDRDLDFSESSPGMVDLWQRQQSVGLVDQSVNLMDPKAAKYEEEMAQLSGLDSLRSGLESFCKSDADKKSPSFAFPTTGAVKEEEEKESTIRKAKIRSPKSKKNAGEGAKKRLLPVLLVICFLVALISVTVLVVSARNDKQTSRQFEGEGIVTAVKSATQEEISKAHSYEAKAGDDDNTKDNAFAVFEAAANASTMKALAAEQRNGSISHAYEVTNEEVIFRPTLTLPAKTKARALIAILLEFKVSNPEDILQPKQQSAAHSAMKWMAEEDPAELAFPSFYYQPPHTATLIRHDEEQADGWRDDSFMIQQLLQRYALAVFYFSLEATTDNTQEELTVDDFFATENHERFHKSWLSADHVCHWHGVDCGTYTQGSKAGVESIHLSSVVSLNLTRHNLVGTLPPEWFSGAALPDLTSVDLSHNHLHGTLPETMATPTETGPFRISTSQGEYLLQFPHNHTLVSSFSADSELLHLDVAHNQFTGTLPPLLRQLEHCQRMFLNHNQFSGHLESLLEDGPGQAQLEQFDVGNNLLTGSIPRRLTHLKRLQLLSLESNFFSGLLPDMFDEIPEMVELHLNDNILEGALPASLGQTRAVERVWLDHNELSGSIPSAWESMSTLERLSIHHNALSGEIPTYFGSSMQQLSDLALQNNRLGGPIPSELGLCTNLKHLYLEENFFRGTPPSSLGNLQLLEKLRLFGNRLTGTMPTSVCHLLDQYQLEYVSSDCKSGHITCSCCNACF